jgi:DNA-binding MarR family transcriptional regulator
MTERHHRRPARALAKGDYELLAAFRHLLRRFLAFSEAAAREYGLTPQQHQALLAIKGFRGRQSVTVGELAEWLDIRHHSAVGLVDRLTSRNLVRRRVDPSDRRRVWIVLTPASEAVLERLSLAHRAELRQLAPRLGSLLSALREAAAQRR